MKEVDTGVEKLEIVGPAGGDNCWLWGVEGMDRKGRRNLGSNG